MPELLISPDAEVAVLDELGAGLASSKFSGAAVGTKIPTTSPKPTRFVRVVGPGGAERDLVTDSALVTIDAYGEREQDARDLAALCVAILQRAGRAGVLGGITCYGVAVGGLPANLPNPAVPTHFRYTATVSADLRKSAA